MLILLGSVGGDGKKAAHRLLAHGLGAYFGLDKVPDTACGPLGKPFFPDFPHIHFNISHSGPYALCALSGSPVGVDIEAVRPRSPRLFSYALTQEERRWQEAHGGGWEAFYTLWTRKESWCKYTGGSAARPKLLCPPLPGEGGQSPAVHSFAGEGWRAAACTAEGAAPNISWFDVTKPGAETIS